MPTMERTKGNEHNDDDDDIAKTKKYFPIPIHSSSGFNARGLKNGDTDSDEDEDDAIGVMIYNSSRTAQIRAAEAAAAMAEEASYDVSSASLTSSSSHHHQFQLEGTTPGRGSFVSSLPSIDRNSNSVSSISNNNYSAASAGSADEEDAKKQMIMNLYQQMMMKHVLTSFLDKANEEGGESTIGGSPVKDCSHHDVSTKRDLRPILQSTTAKHNNENENNPCDVNEEDTNKSFPCVLHAVVSDPNTDNAIHWLPCGTRFVISDRDEFSTNVLPREFDDVHMASFVRRLKRWDFSRVPFRPQTCAYYHKDFHRDKPELAKKIVYPGDRSSNRKCPPLDEGCNKFAHKGGTCADNEAADTLARLANSTHTSANDKSSCGAKRKSTVNDEQKRKRMETCNIYAAPPELDYFMSQYNRSYRPGVYSGSQSYQYPCLTPALGMTNHDNPYSYPHGMVYSGSQSAKAKVARPLCKYEDSTSGTKRKSDSVQYEKKKDKQKRKKKVHMICSIEGCTNIAKKGGVCIGHGAKVKKYTCSHEGCTNHVVNGGVCIRHGAKRAPTKTCRHEGCTNHAKKGGVCIRHGAKVKLCSHEGCNNQAKKGGVCVRHTKVKL